MTYPAWFQFHRDAELRRAPAVGCIYAALVGLENIFFQPRAVKAWVLAEGLHLKKATVLKALDLLVAKGYLVEHDRDANNVRRFTVAIVVASDADHAASELSARSAPKRTEPTAA